jgi:hypothetical protein
LYGRTGKFDVIAIADHILIKKVRDALSRNVDVCLTLFRKESWAAA